MPFKTRYGSHYHMTYGCHGATESCGAEGLEPCSDCCGTHAGSYAGTTSLGSSQSLSAAIGAGSSPYIREDGDTASYSMDGSHGDNPADVSPQRLATSLHRVIGDSPDPSRQASAPAPIPTELIAQMLGTGQVVSVDYDTTTGQVSFKLGTPQASPSPQATATTAPTPASTPSTPSAVGTSSSPDTPESATPTRRERDYGRTDTTDVLREIRGGRHNSLERYLLPDGTLTPEREAVHRRIIDEILSGKVSVSGQATFRMLGGGSASGKSSVVKSGLIDGFDEACSVDVDSDALKEMLPGFADMAAATPDAAAYYHEESSALAKRLMQVAFGENYNVTLDGTGNGSVASVKRKIAQARAAGYRVEAVYVTVDIDTAIERNRQRYIRMRDAGKNPRYVPPQTVVRIHKGVSAVLPEVADSFDSVELYDNSGPYGSVPKLIATGGAGERLTPVPGREKELFDFINKC